MADEQDKDSKTEEASEKKIRDSLEKGQTPFSKETPILISLLATVFVMTFFLPERMAVTAHQLGAMLEQSIEYSLAGDGDIMAVIARVVAISGAMTLPLFAALIVAGITGSVAQNTPRFVGERIRPQISRISLAKGWKRVFSAKGFAEFLKATAKLIFASVLVVIVLHDLVPVMLGGMYTDQVAFMSVIKSTVLKLISAIIFAMVLIATADWFWTRSQWRKDLMMTKQEVKDEFKQQQGDPIVKARMRSVALDRARKRMMSQVPTASLVIANPTHLSIAMRYDPARDAAPIVVAKGRDLIALRIRTIAEENGVPVFQNVELARAMYKNVSIDQIIPQEFFKAVAELISVMRRRQQRA
jgi:flagellar biosynthetic protein FlhB